MNNALLHIDKISYSYNRSDWKLDCIDFSVCKGELIAIVGANGSGKSTLIKIMAGVLQPDSGQILLGDKPIKNVPRKKLAQNIGYLPQQVNSVFDYNVKEVVSMGRFCHSKGLGLTTSEDKQIVDYSMKVTETIGFQARTINRLSGGERQRVLLASVLAQQPEIMLLDEPATGLDLHHQVSFFKLLANFSEKGMAVVVITHDLNLASQFCRKILLLNKGKMVIYDSAEKVFEHFGKMELYSRDISIFRHPLNKKPAILPYNQFSKDSVSV
jgi:iron complex transport system ATP-binding protein